MNLDILRAGTYTDDQLRAFARDTFARGVATAQRIPQRIARRKELDRARAEGVAAGQEQAVRTLKAVACALRRPGGRDEALRMLAEYEEETR